MCWGRIYGRRHPSHKDDKRIDKFSHLKKQQYLPQQSVKSRKPALLAVFYVYKKADLTNIMKFDLFKHKILHIFFYL